MGIHYDYKSKRGERAMLKEAKRKARLAQRRAKRLLSSDSEPAVKEEIKTRVFKRNIPIITYYKLIICIPIKSERKFYIYNF